MRRHWILGLVLLGVLGCQATRAPAPTAGDPAVALQNSAPARKVSKDASNLIGLDGATLIGLDGATLIGLDGATLIGLDGATLIGLDGATLNGKVEPPGLIGLDGATLTGELKLPPGLIGLDGATLIGLDGATLIGLDGATLIGLDGATYRRAGRPATYGLQALEEAPVKGAWVYLRDAEGRFVLGADRKPLRAQTDAEGRFSFPNLKAEAGIFFYAALGKKGDELLGVSAIRPKDQTAPVRVDTASTLLASWVQEEVLSKQPDKRLSLSRLPAALNAEALATTQPLLAPDVAAVLSQGGPELVAARVRNLAAAERNLALRGVLEDVRRVMTLAGLTICQNGVAATTAAAPLPQGLAAAPDGSFYVLTDYSGLVMRVDVRGNISQIAGPCAGTASENSENSENSAYSHVLVGPDSKLYLASTVMGVIWRSNLDGSGVEDWLKTGSKSEEAPRVGESPQGKSWGKIGCLAPGANDTMWMGFDEATASRLVRVSAAGTIVEMVDGPVALEGEFPGVRAVRSLAETPDGALWVLADVKFAPAALYRRPPGETAWSPVSLGELVGAVNAKFGSLLAEPDNTVLVSAAGGDNVSHAIYRLSATAGVAPLRVAGTGVPGVNLEPVSVLNAQFDRPARLARMPDGAVLIADYNNNLVRAWKDDEVSVVAGTLVAQKVVGADSFLNLPTGLTLDAQGRPVLAEAAGSTVRRLQDQTLITIAGGQAGFTGDERAPARRLGAPIDLAAAGEDFYVVELNGRRLRKLYANGEIETVAGGGRNRVWDEEKRPARDYDFTDILAVAVLPDGRPVFSAQMESRPGGGFFEGLFRVEPDGALSHLAGKSHSNRDPVAQDAPIQAGPGKETAFGKILSLAVGPDQCVYAGDVRKCQVVRLTPQGQIQPVVGAGIPVTAVALASGQLGGDRTVPAAAAAVVVPSGLAFDAQGRLLLAEAGTRAVNGFTRVANTSVLPDNFPFPVVDGRIRRLEADGQLVTLAGIGVPGTEKQVRNPYKLVVDAAGQIIFLDAATGQVKSLNLGE